jgi:hypothetical protein
VRQTLKRKVPLRLAGAAHPSGFKDADFRSASFHKSIHIRHLLGADRLALVPNIWDIFENEMRGRE